jgi:hypothetical protein
VSRLRVDVTKLTQLLSRIDNQLTEQSFTAVSNFISQELYSYPEDKTKAGIKAFLANRTNDSVIVTAVYNGVENSKVHENIRELSDECLRLCQSHASNFPVLSLLLGRACLYAKRSADAVLRPTVYIEFLKSDASQQMLDENTIFPEYASEKIGIARMTAVLATLSTYLLKEGEQQDFNDCEAIVRELERFTSTESESKLRDLLKTRKVGAKFLESRVATSKTVTGSMMLCCSRLSPFLGKQRAELIQKLIKQVDQRAPSSDDGP